MGRVGSCEVIAASFVDAQSCASPARHQHPECLDPRAGADRVIQRRSFTKIALCCVCVLLFTGPDLPEVELDALFSMRRITG